MRWCKKIPPLEGTTRTSSKFIWFPTCLPYECNSKIKEWRWLEKCLVEEMYTTNQTGYFPIWRMIAWVDIGDSPKNCATDYRKRK